MKWPPDPGSADKTDAHRFLVKEAFVGPGIDEKLRSRRLRVGTAWERGSSFRGENARARDGDEKTRGGARGVASGSSPRRLCELGIDFSDRPETSWR
ncbi:hypothetical protein AAFF_G00434070 [Aldrovandia affinis]|uniref:Uncharacterized protein n=1 Tax=Aldrovandia affinis TaxID=143900 RepID=A0AAD7S885_9TELE|nr:hypothetical protein AAFF_G00434070 [Aldrovandia affinis]